VLIDYAVIEKEQKKCTEQKKILDSNNKNKYNMRSFEKSKLFIRVKDERERIYVLETLRKTLIEWYHIVLQHPGIPRQQCMMGKWFYWRNMTVEVEKFVQTCHICQKNKSGNNNKYGIMPLKPENKSHIWDVLTVGLLGSWKMRAYLKESNTYEDVTIWSLSTVDELSRWLEVKSILEKSSANIAELVDTQWFCRCPRPLYYIHDNGTEFTGREFGELLKSYGIKGEQSTLKNPQTNAIIERVYLVLGEMCRAQYILEFEKNEEKHVHEKLRRVMQSIAFAIRTTTHSTSGHSPAEMVFSKDMIIHTKSIMDWDIVRKRYREDQIRNNKRENRYRIPHNYRIGDKVLVITKVMDREEKVK